MVATIAKGLALYSVNRSRLEANVGDAGAFVEIIGAGGMTETPGTATVTPVSALNLRSGAITGSVPPGTATIDLPGAIPGHSYWNELRARYRSGATVQFRYTFFEDTILARTGSSITAQIATTGVVTFAGTPVPNFKDDSTYTEGQAIQFGTGGSLKNYVVQSINYETGAVTTNKPGSAVTAGQYAIVLPEMVSSFSASITSFPTFGAAAADSQLSATMEIAFKSIPADPVISNLGD